MKNTLKLIIPLILGLLAGVFNFMALKSSVQEVYFIKAVRDIPIGEQFGPGSVDRLTVLAQHSEGLKGSAVRFEDIGLLSGQTARRTIRSGDVIMYSDTEGLQGEIYDFRVGDLAVLPVSLDGIATPPKMRVGDYVELKIPAEGSGKWIGPFRLVSIGKTISTESSVSDSRTIGIAYDTQNEPQLKELEEFIYRQSVDGEQLISIKLNIR